MTAPSSLPPVRRPRPSGIHSVERRPWWGKFDVLCMFAVLLGMLGTLLGLIGAMPHLAEDTVRILNALHGAASATPDESSKGESDGKDGDGKSGREDHAASLLSLPATASATAAPVGTLIIGNGAQVP